MGITNRGVRMKAILISIKPKYVAEILNGNKTIEVRKSIPKCDLPIDVYIYCTKETQLVKYNNQYVATDFFKGLECPPKTYSGKVIAKFTLNKVESQYTLGKIITESNETDLFLKKCCLTIQELDEYLSYGKTKYMYAWHIDNLVIFDRPRELSEFSGTCNRCEAYKYKVCKLNTKKCDRHLTKAPQSYMFIEIGD